MPYFTPRTLQFFEHLAGHNHKDWFDENRQWYHDEVKDRFDHFLRDLIKQVQKDAPEIMIEPKHAKFRINRDIRFSKDKTPYKTHMSAVISKWGRKDMINPGLYLQVGHAGLQFGSGIFSPDKYQLQAIRIHLSQHQKKAEKLLADSTLHSVFGELQGKKNKRLPKEFQEKSLTNPLLFNKQFYFFKKHTEKDILRDDLIEFCMTHRFAAKPWNLFMKKAFGKPK